MSFKDHFSDVSAQYQQYRPNYPDELYYHLAQVCPQHDLAWDCATGTGQCAIHLARYFEQVIATDGSAEQINIAQQDCVQHSHTKNCTFRVATAEDSGLENDSVDLITVAQAVHWFDLNAFSEEVSRVLKTTGVLSIWSYNLLQVDNEIDALINHFYHEVVGTYWPFERKMVETGYRDLELPFHEIEAPAFDMLAHWDLLQLMGYLGTWSAVRLYQQEQGNNPIDELYTKVARLWGDPSQIKTIRWPLSLRIWGKLAA